MDSVVRDKIDNDIVNLVKDARKSYYAENYDTAINLLTQVLAKEPDYEDAKRVLGQIEKSIQSGEIPQSKIPEKARLEFSTALSLERAGRFEDAKKAYRLANEIFLDSQQTDKKIVWSVAVDAIARIEQYLIADALCIDALKLIQVDKWNEAITNYSNAQKEYGDNFKASLIAHSIEQLQETQTKYLEVQNTLFDSSTVDILESTRKINLAMKIVSGQISRFPESKKWKRSEKALQNKLQDIRKTIQERKNYLINAIPSIDTIVQAKYYVDELMSLLRVAMDTWDDEEFHQLYINYETQSKIINGHWSDFQNAKQLLLSPDKDEYSLRIVQTILISLQSYSLDIEYKQAIHLLKSQVIVLSKECMDLKQIQKAKKIISLLQEEPFTVIDDKHNDREVLKWLEIQVDRDKGNDVLYLWYQSKKLKYEYEELYENIKTYFDNTISRLIFQAQVWFFSSISAALVFTGILAYAILITINKNNPLTLILPILSPVIPIYVTKLLYDQSVAVNDRIRDTSKEKDDRLNDILEKQKKALEELEKKKDMHNLVQIGQ